MTGAAVPDDPLAAIDEVPLVCLDADVCRIFKISLTTLKRLRRRGAFPIPELPSFDKAHRYSRHDVVACLARRDPRGQTRRRAG